MSSGVARGTWQDLPLTRVTFEFHAGRTSQFVRHHVLANHCGFALMLYHESMRDDAKAFNCKLQSRSQSPQTFLLPVGRLERLWDNGMKVRRISGAKK